MSYLSPLLKLENLPMRMNPDEDTEEKRYNKRIVAAEWRVPVHGKLHRIEFEHGTTSGKRVVWVDGKDVLRRDWMFKLVGEDTFTIEDNRCIIRVDPAPNFKYIYLLFVDGKPYDQFKERQAKALKTWVTSINDTEYRIVLEKDTMNIFLNGVLREEVGEFVDNGTDTIFEEDNNEFLLMARRNDVNGTKNDFLIHLLKVNGVVVPESLPTE